MDSFNFHVGSGEHSEPPSTYDQSLVKYFALYCQGTEIPWQFAIWAGIGAVSAALGRRAWIDMGIFTLYPNVYITFVARSAGKKSSSINIAERLLRNLPFVPNLIPQKSTPEALFDAIKTECVDPTALGKETYTGFLFAEELSTFLNRSSYDAGLPQLLTKLYDCAMVDYITKARGKEILKDPCLGMLTGTTVDFIANAFPENAVGGGLTSRIIFVYVDTMPEPVPRPRMGKDKDELFVKMEQSLRRISQMSGQFRVTVDATEFYDRQYILFKKDERVLSQFDNPLMGGYLGRRGNHMLKLAMLLSASERDDLVITLDNMKMAKNLLESVEASMPKVIHLITSNEQGMLVQKALEYLRRMKAITRHEFLRLFANKISTQQFDVLIATLTAMKRCETRALNGEVVYVYVQDVIQKG